MCFRHQKTYKDLVKQQEIIRESFTRNATASISTECSSLSTQTEGAGGAGIHTDVTTVQRIAIS